MRRKKLGGEKQEDSDQSRDARIQNVLSSFFYVHLISFLEKRMQSADYGFFMFQIPLAFFNQ
jgi:hypothetical protein